MRKKETPLPLENLLAALDRWAPFSLQEDYDNAGLVLGSPTQKISRVLVCFDLTLPIVEEAVEKNIQVIVSHHPPIFRGIKRIDSNSAMGRMLQLSLSHNIAWVAMHTNLDNTWEGVNSYLRKALKLKNPHVLVPTRREAEQNRTGAGVVGELPAPTDGRKLLDKLKKLTGVQCIRHSGFPEQAVKRLALCGGSGSGFIPDARAAKADVYITGDLKYHDFTDVPPSLWLVDIGHFESEHFAKTLIHEYISKNFPTFTVLISDRSVNPVRFY